LIFVFVFAFLAPINDKNRKKQKPIFVIDKNAPHFCRPTKTSHIRVYLVHPGYKCEMNHTGYKTWHFLENKQNTMATCFLDCFHANGEIDINAYQQIVQRNNIEAEQYLEALEKMGHDTAVQKKIKRKHRSKKQRHCQRVLPHESLWYNVYVNNPPLTLSFQKKFRRRFRLPYQQYLELLEDSRRNNWFPQWTGINAAGKPSSPLELLLLGALRYIGRGITFDDIEEDTGICQETHRLFFHAFIEIGSTALFVKYVTAPANGQEAVSHMHEMNEAGLHGAIGSMDATHIVIGCNIKLFGHLDWGLGITNQQQLYNG
jgi:hypothetical protein